MGFFCCEVDGREVYRILQVTTVGLGISLPSYYSSYSTRVERETLERWLAWREKTSFDLGVC